MTGRRRVSLSLEESKSDLETADRAAEAEGFTKRLTVSENEEISGRTLRSKGRTVRLNLSVRPETRRLFWLLAHRQGAESGEEFLLHLLNKHKKE